MTALPLWWLPVAALSGVLGFAVASFAVHIFRTRWTERLRYAGMFKNSDHDARVGRTRGR